MHRKYPLENLLATLAALSLMLAVSSCSKPEPTFWSKSERALLQSLALSNLSPATDAPSNRFANDTRAVALGQALFFDARLSASGDISCATCHQAEQQFTDGLVRGVGVNVLTRNTPSIIGGAWQRWFYWDGRRDSLWAQALIPIEAPDEMGGSRVGAIQLIASDESYEKQYTQLFGPLPPALAANQLPDHAGEFTDSNGKNAWYSLPQATQNLVNQAYANIGKAIAAFERTLVPKPSQFDHYVETLVRDGEAAASTLLSQSAINGAKLFIDVEASRCLQCHNGPLLTNNDFHNIGTGTLKSNNTEANNKSNKRSQALDFGRMFGLQAVLLDQFNCLGPYSDAPPEQCSTLRFLSRDHHADIAGAFKTPSLRNVAQTAPYSHNGNFGTLKDVMQHYNSPPTDTSHELVALNLSDTQIKDMVAFLESLSSPVYQEFITNSPPPSAWSESE